MNKSCSSFIAEFMVMSQDPKTLLERYRPKEVKALKPDRQLCIIRFSPCGKFLAAGSFEGTVRRWDATSDQWPELSPLTGHGGWVQAIAFHPDGRRLVSADSWGQLRCWLYAEEKPEPLWAVNQAHNGWIRGLAVSPDGKLLATCGRDQKVCLWSAEDGRKHAELTGHQEDVYSLAFHPDGKSLISGDLKGLVKHWDLETGKRLREFGARSLYRSDRLQDVGGVRCLAFDREGAVLACAGAKPKNGANVQGTPTILLFDWQSGQPKHTLHVGNDGDGYVFDLLMHPDGFVIAVTSGNPGTGKLFFQRPGDAQPFFLATKMANCHSLSLHPNGRRLVVAATNGGSNGNGRLLKNMEYPGNWSPLHVWDLPGDTSKDGMGQGQ
jgi:WD40 repeat protein